MKLVNHAVGMMSGTSLDGIDVAIVEIVEEDGDIELRLKYFDMVTYHDAVKQELLKLCDPSKATIQMISTMNMLFGTLFAEAANQVIKEAGLRNEDIDFISSHGQTIFHQPEKVNIAGHPVTSTLQIGDISVIAEQTGITTVGDFRTRDMAVGGQGAPLAPYADYLLFRDKEKGRVLVNIGGISNMSILPKDCDENDVVAYDTGPGNMIIDYFAQQISNGKISYDVDGKLAAKGNVREEWLKRLLDNPYYAEQPPKSTGREHFGERYAKKLWDEAEDMSIYPYDRIATVTKLTAITITNEINRYIVKSGIREVFISGGGSYNPVLMQAISNGLPPKVVVRKLDEIGMPADAKEAMVFALLGYQYLNKRTNNLPKATGAKQKVMMGKVAWGKGRR
ncbi:anhydro-N-acetylmuramic acid kinase [Ornithinibacillus scapharcae]|uniref:anhydro-N-acetylmuramic acid kinase n=1 Tax=Ornithinibacillus scapharcae TaxID=1147159 RepID=UPI000225B9A7|nr:anhydro-N-acetylmuramic acid kinase [Ornithinibacillus scapharcae]